MKLKSRSFLLTIPIIILSLIGIAPRPLASDSATISGTFYFPLVQELSISSNYPSIITVHKEDKTKARSSICLNPANIDLGHEGGVIELPKAVNLDVLSNVDWRLLVSAENLVLTYTGQAGPPGLDLMVKAVDLPLGVTGSSSYVAVPFGGLAQLVEGTSLTVVPLRKGFSVNYLLKLQQEDNVTVQGINVDLVYTLMQL